MRKVLIIVACLLAPIGMPGAEPIKMSLPDLKGKQHSLQDYQGKWVVVNYWATWCPPCLDEIPELVEFHEQHAKDHAVVLGVNYEEVDKDYLKTFIDEYFVSYPILLADLTRKPPFGSIFGLPTTFIVSPSGELVDTKIGGVTKEWIEGAIAEHTKPPR